jgi:hypothetical protein
MLDDARLCIVCARAPLDAHASQQDKSGSAVSLSPTHFQFSRQWIGFLFLLRRLLSS